MADLVLETKTQPDLTVTTETLMMTPPIGEDYWLYRVRLSSSQAMIGFPKFGTIGIGFQIEDDWNTNLPYTEPAEEIYEHVSHNKGDEGISRVDCIAAILMIQEAVHRDRQSLAQGAL